MPGAVTSGLIQSPVGPREENDAMMSAWLGVAVPCAHVAMHVRVAADEVRDEFELNCVWIAGR